jgi:hypothetical protein
MSTPNAIAPVPPNDNVLTRIIDAREETHDAGLPSESTPERLEVNRLRRHRGVRARDIIVTNSSTSFFAVAAGPVIRATYDGLGQVVTTFAPS